MPHNPAFIDSPELYDAIYGFKNYARECDRLQSLIIELVPDARRVLDVACGTGGHARFLKEHHSVDGIDINEGYLYAARLKNPSGNYLHADMMNFDLGCTYDAVICLFSAIGILKTFERLAAAITCMARHVRPGGTLIVEPWFTPDLWHPRAPFIFTGKLGAGTVYRLSDSAREGQLSVLLHHYLHASSKGIEHYNERIDLRLFSRDEMTWAFEFAGMAVQYDEYGLMGRGLYIGRHDFRLQPRSYQSHGTNFLTALDKG